MNGVVWLVAALAIAYLLGSIPTGYWLGRLLKGIDIREHGSGSTGATNVLRTIGKVPALIVLTVDVLKGVFAVQFARWLYGLPDAVPPFDLAAEDWLPWIASVAGLLALLGHSRSVWIRFTGGKSVATGLGVLLALSWQIGLAALGAFGLVLAATRIVSLSSIAAALAAGGLAIALQTPAAYQLMAIAGGLYVILRHRTNIQRLLAGTEPRIGQKHQES